MFLHTPKANQAGFGICPKTFYAVDMTVSICKLILTVLYPVMLLVAKVYQSIVAAPSIRMADTCRVYSSTNNALQRSSGAIRHDFCVNAAMPSEQAENYSFSKSASAPDTFNPPCSKVTFIHFNFAREGRFSFTGKGNPFTYPLEQSIHSIAV